MKDFGRTTGGNDIHDEIGFNFKFTELQACVGIEQMKKLPAAVKGRQVAAERLIKGLSGLDGLELPQTLPGFTHSYYMFFMKIDSCWNGRMAFANPGKKNGKVKHVAS